MPYIGQAPTQAAFVTDTFSGNGSTTAFTMSVAPAGTTSVLVAVSGVLQDPSTYSVTGTTLTFSGAPPTGTGNISARYLGIPASGVTTTAYRTITEFTATAGQTTFTPPSYTVGFINVYRNGVLLGSADYTATNGTTVVLATGATSGDLVTVESFLVSSVLNAIPATTGSISLAGPYVTGVLPSANLPTGSVLQVVSATFTSNFSTTTNGFVSTQVTASITPKFSNSKIRVEISPVVFVTNALGGANDAGTGFGILRGATQVYSTSYIAFYSANANAGTVPYIQYLDSPSTTSSTSYTLQVTRYTNNGGTTVQINRNYVGTDTSVITLTEIAG